MNPTNVSSIQTNLLGHMRRSAFELCAADDAASAFQVLDAALAICPRDCELQSDIAALHLHEGRLDPAINAAREALANDANHDPSAYTLALALGASGCTDEARFVLTELTEGLRGERFARMYPDLHAHAVAQRKALETSAAAAAADASTASPSAPAASTRFTAEGAAKYSLHHLTQKANQDVGGPIQDDEALALYALVRVMRLKRVLEIGGLSGYSARNFLAALGDEGDAAVYTVDINPVQPQAPHHHVLTKSCADVHPHELHGKPLDLIFFDAHVFDEQMALLARLQAAGMLRPDTVIALHDTNLHPRKTAPWSYPITDTDGAAGFVHQAVERQMANRLHELGWDALCLHFDKTRSDDRLPIRHGITLMQRFRTLGT